MHPFFMCKKKKVLTKNICGCFIFVLKYNHQTKEVRFCTQIGSSKKRDFLLKNRRGGKQKHTKKITQ